MVTLAVRDAGRLGQVVVDTGGFTLYRFEQDAAERVACVDACTTTWQPVLVDPAARLTVDGVDAGVVGLVRRADGTVQLTLAGWPLYRFAGDSIPGEHGGQGIGDAWFAITPAGLKATIH